MIKLLGAGGHAAVILDVLEEKEHHNVDVYDDKYSPDEYSYLLHHRLVGTILDAYEHAGRFDTFVVGIGDNKLREQLSTHIINNGMYLEEAVIHPRAIVSNRASIGDGSVVFAGAVVQARAQIGYGVIVNTGSTVDHDCIIYDFAHICPGVNLAGNVTVGERSMIGIGSSVIQGIKIGADITVGAGSVVVEDLKEPGLYVGCPAKLIKKKVFKC